MFYPNFQLELNMNLITANANRDRKPRTYPLYIRIGGIFSLLILVTGLVIGWLSYLSARNAATEFADNAMTGSAAQMISTIKQLYSPMDTLVGLLAYHQVTQAKTLEQRLESLHFFREAMIHNPQISAVYTGYENGDFFLVRHLRRAEVRTVANAPKGTDYLVQSIERNTGGKLQRRFLYYNADLKLVRADLRTDYNFDPRTRPWFRQNPDILSSGTTHTAPYLFFTTHEIGQTFARRAINGKAVVAADLTLIDLSETLARQKVTQSTELALFDLQGHLLGYKDPSRLIGPKDHDGNPTQNNIEQLGVPIISRAFFDLARKGLTNKSMTLKESGREWYVRIQPLQTQSTAGTGNEAKTFFAIAAPTDEVFAYALRIRNEMLLVTLLILLLAIPITWWLATRVTSQLKELSRQADDIKNFRFHTPDAAASTIYEIEHLSSTIAQLKGTISIIDGSPIPAYVIGKDHLVIHWNKALEEISGIKSEEVVGTREHWRAFYSEERPCMADLMVDEAVELVPRWYSDKYIKSSLFKGVYEATDFFPALGEDGKWLHFTAAAVRDSNGMIVAAIETVEDITERKQAEARLLESRTKLNQALMELELILKNASIGILTVVPEPNGQRLMRRANDALERLLGYEHGELEGLNTRILYPRDEEYDAVSAGYVQVVCAGGIYHGEHELLRKDGQTIFGALSGSAIDLDNPLSGAIWLVADITERKRNQEQIKQLAYYDALTNLPNRRLMLERLNLGLIQAKRFHRSMAIMFMDLDYFKEINDTLGHDIGDELLKAVASRLISCVRGGDTVSRLGGDEFVVVLNEITQPEDAALVAEKIINIVKEPVIIQGNELQVTMSIGIAVYPIEGIDDPLGLMKKADIAMYQAKNGGRNGFRFYQ
jgi:diguanylate cyclase (GGDEF)-like protein/PAS domain S-box-containing protein